ncbi:Caspase domain protein [Symmachiella macrocystis]|uniref:Caspase domain protein n=1 Tax=Symmachiella macrocystis TaxID=2527985 RepID=A0A5C6AVF5_9PLAN|nr:caspase family protein [Symmachiella macrocystis]TWU03022.1 Caspase domain protein [Symmachiella macrocystis]
MSFSMSLHIGVNEVDPDTYGEVPRLRSAVKDAEAMEQIATDLEYQDTFHLHNEDATVSAVLTRIGEMALQIEPGGVAMVTYAGHGSEVPDDTGDEQSGRDQTWVLYDKMLIDDQLRAMWGRFAPGVRVFFVSDSCHSGSMARTFKEAINKLKDNTPQFLLGTRDFIGPDIPKERILPPDAALQAFSKYESEIVSTQWTCGNRGLGVIGATVISLAACQDDEVAGDGANNGVFTAALLQVWNNGQFSGSSQQFLDAIARKTRMYQRPRFEAFGASNPGMMEQLPFGVALSGFRGLPADTFQVPPDKWSLDWCRKLGLVFDQPVLGESGKYGLGRGIGNGGELTTFDEPAFRCALEFNPAASKMITPELFETAVKQQLADALSAAFLQVHGGLVARGAIHTNYAPRDVHGEISGKVSCDKDGCKGEVGGSIRF